MTRAARNLGIWACLVTGACGCTSGEQTPPAPAYSDGLPTTNTADPADRAAVIDAGTAFALDLYGGLRGGEGNLVLSPYSIATALAMTYAGARGQTAEQLAAALNFRLPPEKLHPAFAALIHDLHGGAPQPGVQLSAANALWWQTGLAPRQEFLQTVRANYGGVLKEADFRGDPAAARRAINAWVSEKTANRVQEFLPADLLTEQTRIVLTNAVAFKGTWAWPFEKTASQREPFHVNAGRKVTVTMMHQERHFNHLDGGHFQAVELPYRGGRFSLVILLPNEADGLPELERSLTPEKLRGWLGKLGDQEVHIALPRFKAGAEFRLRPLLGKLGITDLFDPPKADLSGMSTAAEKLFVAEVLHKAAIEVNEEGTEARAESENFGHAWNGAIPFRANHPFLFLVRDIRTGAILFLGRVTEPGE